MGLVADDFKAAIAGEDWANVVSHKSLNDTDYLTRDCAKLFCVLWGVVKKLSAGVAALEA